MQISNIAFDTGILKKENSVNVTTSKFSVIAFISNFPYILYALQHTGSLAHPKGIYPIKTIFWMKHTVK